MVDFPECEQYTGLQRANCRGERLTPQKCDRWRVAVGLAARFAPVDNDAEAAAVHQRRSGGGMIRVVAGAAARLNEAGAIEPPPPPVPEDGPGTEFFLMMKELKISEPKGCSCAALRARMDILGVEGCRRERESLLSELRANAEKVDFWESVRAVPLAAWMGYGEFANPTDPLPGLFDEAVRRYEAKQRLNPEAAAV